MKTKPLGQIVTTLCALIILSACSTRAWYESAKHHHQTECDKLAGKTAFEECSAASLPDYKEYRAEREKLLKGSTEN